MKKIVLLLGLIIILGSACAGLDQQYQRNMAVNAAGYGLAGAGAAGAIASVTHGNVGKAATIGGIAGAVLGAANTPPPPPRVVSPPQPPQSQPAPQAPPAVYAPPPAVYYPPVVVYYPPPAVLYAPPVVYGGYYAPYCGFGGINVMYFGGNYWRGYKHHGHHRGYDRYCYGRRR